MKTLIGATIKNERKKRKLTQKQLGELIGKSAESIKKYESGFTDVSISVLEDIASALNLSISDFTIDFKALVQNTQEYASLTNFLNHIGYDVESYTFGEEGEHGELSISINNLTTSYIDSEIDQFMQDIKDYIEFLIYKHSRGEK